MANTQLSRAYLALARLSCTLEEMDLDEDFVLGKIFDITK